MYPVSDAFKQAIKQNTREYHIAGVLALKNGDTVPISDKIIKTRSLQVENQCVNGSELELGAVYAAQVDITLYLSIDRYQLYDAQLNLDFALRLWDGTFESVPIGIYTVSEANRSFSMVNITAYDNMLKFDKGLNVFPQADTPYVHLQFCCEKCGVELGNTQAEIDGMPNGTLNYSIYSDNDIQTYRDLIHYIAQVLCGFATIGRDGKLYIRHFGIEAVDTIPENHRYQSTFSDFQTRYSAISSTNARTQIAEYYPLEVDDALTMNLQTNPLLQFEVQEVRERVLQATLEEVSKICYVPFETKYSGDPSFDPGDAVIFSGGHADANSLSCITHFSFKYRGQSSLKGVGENPKLMGVKSKNDKNIAGLLNQVSDKGFYIYEYTNSKDLTVQGQTVEILYSEFATARETDVEFQAVVLLDAVPDEGLQNCLARIEYYRNDNMIEDFIPLQTLPAGRFILNLYYVIAGVPEKTRNSFRVRMSIESGMATIAKFQVRAVIKGQGLASGKAAWDGTLEINEEFGGLSLPQNQTLKLGTYTDEVTTTFDTPTPGALSDNFTGLKLNPVSFKLGGFTDSILTGLVIKVTTLYGKDLIGGNPYLQVEGDRLLVKTAYSYDFVEQQIDEGRMCSVEINTKQFESIEGMEVIG